MDVRIESLAYGGRGVGRVPAEEGRAPGEAGMLVYCPKGASPGDVVRLLVKKVRRKPPKDFNSRQSMGELDRAACGMSYVEALFVERLEVSPDAVQPPCKHFGNARLGGGTCGGCATMDMRYGAQIAEKQRQVQAMFDGLAMAGASGGDGDVVPLSIPPVGTIVPCDKKFAYRNKMEFSYGRKWFTEVPPAMFEKKKPMAATDVPVETAGKRRGRRRKSGGVRGASDGDILPRTETQRVYALGMHAPGRYDRVVEIDDCHLQSVEGNAVLNYVRRRCDELEFMPYDAVDGSGLMRNVMIRSAINADGQLELMVNLMTSVCEVPQRLVPLATELMETFPEIICVVQNMPSAPANTSMDPSLQRLLAGERTYIEQGICGLSFEISANSFFQTNAFQAEQLYTTALSMAGLRDDDVLLDLFCGTGTIGLSMATHCKRVVGVEVVADAVADAKRNAKRNGIENAEFIEGNLDSLKNTPLAAICGENAAEVIIVDPPRSGIGPKLAKELARTSARTILYISCNPSSQVRDLGFLHELAPGRFIVDKIVPVDMFPHTPHIECVVAITVNPAVPPPARRFAADTKSEESV